MDMGPARPASDGLPAPMPEAAATAVENSTPIEGRAEYDMAMDLERDTTASGSYPIVLVSYHLYCSQYDSQETADLAKAFGEYVVSAEGQTAAEESAGNAPISDATREAAVRSAAQEERTRVAREVHDAVAHSVSVMTLQIGGLQDTVTVTSDAPLLSASSAQVGTAMKNSVVTSLPLTGRVEVPPSRTQ